MPLLREVRREEADSPVVLSFYDRIFGPDRDPVAQPGTSTGTPGNWWTVMANVPDILDYATRGFAMMGDPARELPGRIKELGRLRAAWDVQSQFVFSQHCKAGRSLGLTEEEIEGVPSWELADCYSDKERAFLAFTDSLVLQHGRVAPELAARLTGLASDTEILEFTYSTLTYVLHAIMCRALRLEYDDVDERIVEIAAPDGSQVIDVNTLISARAGQGEQAG
ncbi:MAG TPA: carboxymuconolactone decarboxylase family protein [Acidimicrobiales bacterium]|jgi:alkylhydroperoxidase family enzyme|nr:carboxymuconolactone decarboxylase family protein [Acidimicrobiales bacterium]